MLRGHCVPSKYGISEGKNSLQDGTASKRVWYILRLGRPCYYCRLCHPKDLLPLSNTAKTQCNLVRPFAHQGDRWVWTSTFSGS